MLLGMLVSRSDVRQVQLVQTPGAVAALMALIRGEVDPDAKAIASDLFKLLVNNPEAKDVITAAMRGDIADDSQNFL